MWPRIIELFPLLSCALPPTVERSAINFSWQLLIVAKILEQQISQVASYACTRGAKACGHCSPLVSCAPSFSPLVSHCFSGPTALVGSHRPTSLIPFCPLLQVKLKADTQNNMSHTLARIQARLFKSAWMTNLPFTLHSALVTKS